MHEVLVNRLGGLSLRRKCVARLTDRPDITLDVYRDRKTTTQQQQQSFGFLCIFFVNVFQFIVMLAIITILICKVVQKTIIRK